MSNENALVGSRWANKEQWGWSYDSYISHENGLDFLKAILVCTKGDGVISEPEREWVLGFAVSREMPESVMKEAREYDANEDIADILSRNPVVKKGKQGTIYWAIKACSADEDYNDDEKAAIRKMASLMEISDEIVEQIEAVIIEEQILREKRNTLIYDGKIFWD